MRVEENTESNALLKVVNKQDMRLLRDLLIPIVNELTTNGSWCGTVKNGFYAGWMEYNGRGVYGVIGYKFLQIVGGN